MERLRVAIKIPSEVAAYEQKQLQKLQKSPFIQDYLGKHNMSDQDLIDNIPFFMQLVEEVQECKACKGLDHCVKKERGFVPTLKKN